MDKYLLVAEANKIQDFIFRALRLSEVVGGSQILTRFCDQVIKHLLTDYELENNLLVHDGGKFVAIFDDEQRAYRFGDELAEAYRRVADGSLIVAKPIPYNNRDFSEVYKEADEELRTVKRSPSLATGTVPHLPYLAICASCGVGLAVAYQKLYKEDDTERPNYLCQACKTKIIERQTNIQGDDYFLWPFIKEVSGDNLRYFDWTTRPKHISEYDPRHYVAYMVADGNSMGKIFGQCNEGQIKSLSEEMTPTLRACLAEPTRILKKQNQIDSHKVPVLPLIIGGDDVFALLPAPWALSFAFEFCCHYQDKMSSLLKKQNLFDPLTPPTISVSIIICKETYPHNLAHQIGQQRVDYAKQVSKSAGVSVSAIDFQVIIGNEITSVVPEARVRSTLRPYLIQANDQISLPENIGLPLHRLINQRLNLQNLPGKRLAQLRQHFDQLPDNPAERQKWAEQLQSVVKRISRSENEGKVIEEALTDLGKFGGDRLRLISRPVDERPWSGHGLPDLLHIWDFAFDLKRNRDDYEG